MRRGLKWSLGAASVASIAALLGPRAPGLVSAMDARVNSSLERLADLQPSAEPSVQLMPLPTTLPSLSVGPAKRDIFAAIQAPLLAQVSASPPVPSSSFPPAAAPPPIPQAPPANARYLGSMTGPDGKRLVYLARGDTSISISVGQQLDDGYVVEAITLEAVTLLYPPLDTRVTLPVPQVPAQ